MTTLVTSPRRAMSSRTRSMGAVLAAVGIPMFMVTLDNLVVTTALPVIRTSLGASLTDLQWFVNAYTLSFAALLLSMAALGDRIGRRRLFLAGITLFTAASAACALATEPWQLTAARAIQGAAGAAVMPLSLTLLAAEVKPHLRTAAIGIWSGISGLGVAVGPVVGGAVTEGLHWTWIFWLNVPVGLVAIPLAAVVLRESRAGAGRLDPLGLVLSSASVLALVWGVVNGSDKGWTSTPVLTALIAGTVLLATFLAWEKRAAAPMLPLHLFRSRQFTVINAVAFIFSAGVFGAIFLLAQFLQVVQGIDPLAAGIRTLPWTIAPMIIAPLSGLVLVAKFGGRTLIITGMTLLTTALAWLALTSTVNVSYKDLIVAFILAGVGMGLMFAPMSTLTLESTPTNIHGVASGTLNTMRELGVTVGVATLASVFAANGNYTTPTAFTTGIQPALWTGATLIAAGTLLSLALPRKTQ